MMFLRRLLLNDGLALQKENLFDAISDDILIDIFTRLPPDQILHCKGMCNRWTSLILDPRFVKLHLSRAVPEPFFQRGRRLDEVDDGLGLFFIDWEAPSQIDKVQNVPIRDDLVPNERETMLRSCCNGLVVFGEKTEPFTHFLCNPTTKEVVLLGSVEWICGLYFHSTSNTYRLLCVDKVSEEIFRYYVTDLDLIELKEVGAFNHSPRWNSMSCFTVDSYMYLWIPTAPCSSMIMSFQLDTEEMSFRPHPPFLNEHNTHYNMHMIEMRSQLGFAIIVKQVLDVLVLEDRSDWVWTKKYSVNLVRRSWFDSVFESAFDPPELGDADHRHVHCLSVRNQELILWYPDKGILKYHLVSGRVEQLASAEVWLNSVRGFVTNGKRSLISPRLLISSAASDA